MVFPIAGGNESKGYDVENSLRFNDDDSPLLTRAISTDPSDQKLTTISFWFKIGNITSAFRALYRFNDGSNTGAIYLRNGNDLQFAWDVSSGTLDVRPDGVLRDSSAWYHCHIKVDTTQGTAANRVIIHINGVERSYSTATYPNQNTTLKHLSNGETYYIGGDGQSSDKYFDGYIAEFNVIDGQAKDYTDFGEFDNNGVWIPKKYTGTYGNNGFYLEFQQTGTSANSSGIGADTSGNDLHWTPSNLAATDITEDTCTNNFATMNPLESSRQQGGAATFAEGNLQITTSYVDADYQRYPQVYSTQAVSSGKWYFEMKITTSDTDSFIGVHSPDNYASDGTTNPYGGYASTGAIYTSRGAVRINDGQTTGHGTTSQNDIVGCALDIDNNKVYFHKNGTYVQSGDPAGNSGGQAIPSGYTYGFTVGNDTASDSGTMQVNFGNPVHTISSGNTDGKYGNFEYAVPSGFYAVCTKRLAEFG